ncbi:MAG TPA: alkaline phosphatase family protein, partial [Polyangia bacterium]|nr:alkaline phosphatase family protein [Polyangia bacterium]
MFLLICTLAASGGACRRKTEKTSPPPPPAQAAAPAAPAVPANPAPKSGRAAIRHVVIISEDGLRPDALAGVRPPVHEAILKRAAYSLRARTIRRASTLPSHAAMLSGFDIKEHGLFWNSWHPDRGYIHVPTVFDAAAKNGGSAAFIGKRKLEHIAHPGSVDVVSRP